MNDIVDFSDDESGDKKELSMFDQAIIVATVQSRWTCNPSYMHTFGITDNYFIIIEQPLSVALITLAACQLTNKPLCTSLKWYDNENVITNEYENEMKFDMLVHLYSDPHYRH